MAACRVLSLQVLDPPGAVGRRTDHRDPHLARVDQRLLESDLSIDAPLGGTEDGRTFGESLSSPDPDTEDIVSDADLARTLHSVVDEFAVDLDERETRILRGRILAEDRLTLQQIGEEFDLTRERVRQIESQLVKRLREFMREKLVDFDYFAPED